MYRLGRYQTFYRKCHYGTNSIFVIQSNYQIVHRNRIHNSASCFTFSLLLLAIGSARNVTALENHVLRVERLVVEEGFENLLGSFSIAQLSIQRGTRVVWGHTIIRHISPRVVLRNESTTLAPTTFNRLKSISTYLGSRLGIPDIASITCNVTTVDSLHKCVSVNDGASSSVDEISTLLHLAQDTFVEQASCGVV